ncbi:MAG TPA: IPT/TIG domain-containing protein [Candidatus Anoxymicrobiaceae bacterium]
MYKRALISIVMAGLLLAAISLTGMAPVAAAGQAAQGTPATAASPPSLGTSQLPSSVDLSSEVPPVGDQTDIGPGCQTCQLWAGDYYMFTQYVKHFLHPEWDLNDPRHVFGSSFNNWDSRGPIDGLVTAGNVDIVEIPYNPVFPESSRPTAAQMEAAKQYRIGGYTYVWNYGQTLPPTPLSDETITAAKAWLASGRMLDVGISAFSDFPRQHGDHSQDTHYYDPTPSGPPTIGHQVDFCGYDDNINPAGADADHRGGFLMVNCWGTDWNGDMHGYVWMSYAYVKRYVGNCAVITSMPSDKPSITGCNTNSGKAGDTVVISGNNFGTDRRATRVTFNGVASHVDGWVNDSIITSVPWNATSGPLLVNDWEGTPSNAVGFTVNHSAPTLTSMAPCSGAAGNALMMPDLTGADFYGTPVVKLKKTGQADIVASSVQVLSSTKAICSFDLSHADPGPWDVYIQNPDGQSATKAGAYTVTTPIWYLAEGSTGWGFNTRITIENPQAEEVHAKVTYLNQSAPSGSGKVAEKTLILPALSQTTIANDAIESAMGGPSDFSTMVECVEGNSIAVDRTMSWTGQGAPSAEAHASVGVTSPSTTWYLPEGSAAWGFETWTLVENPGTTEANVTLTYMTRDGFQKVANKKVAACSRASFSMAADIGSRDASVQVTSDVPVIAESSQYRNNRREGSNSVGATAPASDYFLSEGSTAWGFTTYLMIENPGSDASTVTVTYMTPSGPKAQAPFTMGPISRRTIRVNDSLPNTDFSTRVHGTKPIVAERSMYWGAGTPLGEACHSSIGLAAAHTTFYLPDGYSDPEDAQSETWTLVQNPNDTDVAVQITYLKPDGKNNVTFTDTVPANSRKTYDMADKLDGRAAIKVTSLTAGKKIMVERAMYWNGRGAGTDTIGAYSD